MVSDRAPTRKDRGHKKTTWRTWAKFMTVWLIGSVISIIGMYAHLKFPKAGLLKVLAIALPFCWVDWYFTTWAIQIQHEHKLLTPTQDTMLLIAVQFTLLLLLNRLYLKQPVTRSDIVALPIILVGMYISGKHVISHALGWKVPHKRKAKEAHPHKLHVHHKFVDLTAPSHKS